MNQDIKNNKNSALVHQYTHKFILSCKRAYNKTDICEITIYFCCFIFLLFTFKKLGMKDYGRPFVYQQCALTTLML